ncbi:AraC family transcriptional regulator ligand-binding domain-containing protein [Aquirhabdus sp.]|uniref:AraC family transcriptional regulator n=1 Tax=Aquirhabdus sp. TaxID=2824160 RepID=UPI00396C9A59
MRSSIIRSSSPFTFPIQYVEMVEALVRLRGGDVQQIYVRAQLEQHELDNPETRISLSQFAELMQIAKEHMNSAEPASIQMLRHMPVTIHGMLGMASISADTLGDALDITLRYFSLILPCIELTRENRGNKVFIYVRNLVSFGSPFDETMIEIVIGNFFKMVSFSETPANGKEISEILGSEVHFRHACFGDAAVYQRFCNTSIKFSCLDNQMIFAREVLSRPLVTRNRSTRMALETMLETKLQLMQKHDEVAVRVRRLLSGSAALSHFPDPQQIADAMAMSTRTLSRRLSEEGHSLSKLMEELRMERAEMLLIGTQLSLFNIAKQLGYSDLSAFSRAFKRVKKQSPSELRASLKP